MSLDNFSDCGHCGKLSSAPLWVTVHRTLEEAARQPGGLGVLECLMPQPHAIKLIVCFACGRVTMGLSYTPEEAAKLKEFQAKRNAANAQAEKLAKLFGVKKEEEPPK